MMILDSGLLFWAKCLIRLTTSQNASRTEYLTPTNNIGLYSTNYEDKFICLGGFNTICL